jgi:hypothetical protein
VPPHRTDPAWKGLLLMDHLVTYCLPKQCLTVHLPAGAGSTKPSGARNVSLVLHLSTPEEILWVSDNVIQNVLGSEHECDLLLNALSQGKKV